MQLTQNILFHCGRSMLDYLIKYETEINTYFIDYEGRFGTSINKFSEDFTSTSSRKPTSVNTLAIGCINEIYEIKFDFFQVEEMEDNYIGMSTELQLKLPWIRLYQRGVIYKESMDDKFPLDKFNHVSLFFSPNI